MTAGEISKKICDMLENKKAVNIKLLPIKDVSVLADYMIVATGTSSTHVKSLAQEVEYQLKQEGISPNGKEGFESGIWLLLDYGDIIVNVFSEESRGYYSIEEFWKRTTS